MNANSVYPCFWSDNRAREMAEFHIASFGEGRIIEENPVVVYYEVLGQKLMALNGGDHYKPNPSISHFVFCNDKEEVSRMYETLSKDGRTLMPLDSYDWSERYAWVQDRYGINWQLHFGLPEHGQRLVPCLMFCGEQQGKAEQAMRFYASTLKNTEITGIVCYPEGHVKGQVVHGTFRIGGKEFVAMDSHVPQPFTFGEGVSLVLPCKDQEEIDYYWEALTREGKESVCGWCKDPYGVSWQVIPANISDLLFTNPNAEKASQALMQMSKIDIRSLAEA